MHGTLKTGQRVEPSHMDHTAAGDVQGPSTPAPLVRSFILVLMDVQTLGYDMPKSNVRSRRSEIFGPLVSTDRLGVRSTNLSFNFPDCVGIETLDSKVDCSVALVKTLSRIALT